VRIIENLYTRIFSKLLYVGMVGLTLADKFITPPARYQYLWHLLFAMVGFVVFMIVFVYSNLKMIDSYNRDSQKENEVISFHSKQATGKNE